MSTPVAADVLTGSPPAAARLRPLARWRRRVAVLGESRPAAVGLAIILAIFRHTRTVDLKNINLLQG